MTTVLTFPTRNGHTVNVTATPGNHLTPYRWACSAGDAEGEEAYASLPFARDDAQEHADTCQQGRPIVWILSKGEHHEGGDVIAVFADRDLARGQFAHEAQNMAFAIDDARQDEDGSIHLDAGCDWLALEPHQVITREQLT